MITKQINLYLPWPPTINDYYGCNRGVKYIKKKGRVFRDACNASIVEQDAVLEIPDRMHVEVFMFPPDRRARDLDNYTKPLLDACTISRLWVDDKLIDQLPLFRGEVVKGGVIKLQINPAGPIIPFTKGEIEVF